MPGNNLSHLPTKQLVTPRRLDLAIKWRFFRHLCTGDDPDSERVYRQHLEARKTALAEIGMGMDRKANTDQYITDCRHLLLSMAANGFLVEYAISIDPDGEMLSGAHRVACALALGIKDVPIERHTRRVFAPPWNRAFFVESSICGDDLVRLISDFNEVHNAS